METTARQNSADEKVAVVVVNHRQDRYLPELSESIADQGHSAIEAVIVSDAPIGCMIPSGFETIVTAWNRGYGAAANVGIKWGMDRGCDAFFILNGDTRLGPGCIGALASSTGDIVSPIIFLMRRPSRINAAGIVPTRLGLAYCGKYGQRIGDAKCRPSKILAASGAAMFIRRRVIEKAGLFDESFFLYLEDVDYSLMARRAGFDIVLEPSAVVWHDHRMWSGIRKIVYLARNSGKIRHRYRDML